MTYILALGIAAALLVDAPVAVGLILMLGLAGSLAIDLYYPAPE